jgi:Spy/CpxP family protein refolding chaperone
MKHRQMSKMTFGLAIAALGISGGVTALAQGPGDGGFGPHRPPMEQAMGPRGEHGHEMGRFWNDPRAIEKFKLTETQRKAMDDVYMQHRIALVDLHGTLEKAELSMEPLMSADQPDETKILAQIDKIAAARAELEKANARMLFEIRRQLTPEQWKLVQADRASRREGRDGNGHGMDGRGMEGRGQDGRGPGGNSHWRPQGKSAPGTDGSKPASGGTPAPPPPGEEE